MLKFSSVAGQNTLICREYKPILKECVQEEGRLLFELKRHEAQALCRAFDEKTNGRRNQARPMPSATGADTQMVPPSVDSTPPHPTPYLRPNPPFLLFCMGLKLLALHYSWLFTAKIVRL